MKTGRAFLKGIPLKKERRRGKDQRQGPGPGARAGGAGSRGKGRASLTHRGKGLTHTQPNLDKCGRGKKPPLHTFPAFKEIPRKMGR